MVGSLFSLMVFKLFYDWNSRKIGVENQIMRVNIFTLTLCKKLAYYLYLRIENELK